MGLLIGCLPTHNLVSPLVIGTPTALTIAPASGGDWSLQTADSGIVQLNQAGTTTTVTMSVPVGSMLVGSACKITTAISGVSATGVTVAVAWTGGSSLTPGVPSFVINGDGNIALNTKSQKIYDYTANNIVISSVANLQVAISGGADNTPSAGAVQCVAHYTTVAALD